MKSIIPIYKDELEDVFDYDEKTNILKRELKSGRMKVVNISVKNTKNGYVRVSFKGRMILVHRVIYTLVHGNIPENMTIDHIDEVKTNNYINNLQRLSNRDNNAKSRGGLAPYFNKGNQSYHVREQVRFGDKQHRFHFKYFKILSEAQAFCKAYKAQFGFDMPLWDVRKSTPEHWKSCMQTFKDMYFNTEGVDFTVAILSSTRIDYADISNDVTI